MGKRKENPSFLHPEKMSTRRRGSFRIPNKKEPKDNYNGSDEVSTSNKRKFKNCISDPINKNKDHMVKRAKREKTSGNNQEKGVSLKEKKGKTTSIAININKKTSKRLAGPNNDIEKENESPLKKTGSSIQGNITSSNLSESEEDKESLFETYDIQDKIANEIELLVCDMLNEICNTIVSSAKREKDEISSQMHFEDQGISFVHSNPLILPQQKPTALQQCDTLSEEMSNSQLILENYSEKIEDTTDSVILSNRQYMYECNIVGQYEIPMIRVIPEYSSDMHEYLNKTMTVNGDFNNKMLVFLKEAEDLKSVKNEFDKHTNDSFEDNKVCTLETKITNDKNIIQTIIKDKNMGVVKEVDNKALKIDSEMSNVPENKDNRSSRVGKGHVLDDILVDIYSNEIVKNTNTASYITDLQIINESNKNYDHYNHEEIALQMAEGNNLSISETDATDKFQSISTDKFNLLTDCDATSCNKPLKISYMSALDYEKEIEKKSENYLQNSDENQGSSDNSLSPLNLEDSSVIEKKDLSFQHKMDNLLVMDDLERWEFLQAPGKEKSDDFLNSNSKVGISDNKDKQSSVKIKKPTTGDFIANDNNNRNEQLNNFDKMKKTENEICCKSMNIISDNEISEITETNTVNDDNLHIEPIVFRERDESIENDTIPTGMFKHMNEIFEYNKETTTVEVRNLETFSTSKLASSLGKRDELDDNNGLPETIIQPIDLETLKACESTFLVTVSDYLKSTKESRLIVTKQEKINSEKLDDGLEVFKNVEKESEITNEEITKLSSSILDNNIKNSNINQDAYIEKTENVNKTDMVNSLEDMCHSQNSLNELKSNSDIENCMDMDDDFDLTPSQLSMLDANVKMQVESTNRSNSSQQTDISGYTYFGNDAVTFEIINELHFIR